MELQQIKRNIKILEDLKQLSESKLLSQKKNVRRIIYNTKKWYRR
jgi:hypothetical protein